MMLPKPGPEIFHGLAGELVDLFKPYTEAGSVAIAVQHLVMFGNAAGSGPVSHVGETPHHTNENVLIVGTSSRARKGDSGNIASKPLCDADPTWTENIASGLSSGEGLIHAVRDPVWKDSEGERVLVDSGVSDKRLCVLETEFSTALKQFSRQGNVLSSVLRDAWDCKPVLRTLTKNSPLRATGAHISIVAHTTPEDLHAHLTDVDTANGLGNRFIVILTHRERKLPNPGRAPSSQVAALASQVRRSLDFAREVSEIRRSRDAERLWGEVYEQLTEDKPGLIGKLLARSESHVLRLSALYALYARSPHIDTDHLLSALALWDYSEASVHSIFGQRTGRPGADRILTGMMVGEELNLTQVRSQIFSNHISQAGLDLDLRLLEELGLIRTQIRKTGGRPELLVTRIDTSEEEDKGPPCAESASSAESEESAGASAPEGSV